MNIDFTKYQITCLLFDDKRNLKWEIYILLAVALQKKKKNRRSEQKRVYKFL